MKKRSRPGKRAAQIDPNNQFVWSSLSLAYNANKQKAEAEAAGAKARIISWGGKIKPEALDSNAAEIKRIIIVYHRQST